MSGAQIVTSLADRITCLFDDAGASRVERYCALDVARALVEVSEASSVLPSSDSVLESRRESTMTQI